MKVLYNTLIQYLRQEPHKATPSQAGKQLRMALQEALPRDLQRAQCHPSDSAAPVLSAQKMGTFAQLHPSRSDTSTSPARRCTSCSISGAPSRAQPCSASVITWKWRKWDAKEKSIKNSLRNLGKWCTSVTHHFFLFLRESLFITNFKTSP